MISAVVATTATHHARTAMFDKLTMTDAECSPWPPVLWFTPEVQSGIQAATDLAFGREPTWNDRKVPAHDFLTDEDGDDLIIE